MKTGIYRAAAVMSRKVDTLKCPIVFPDMTGMVDVALDELVAEWLQANRDHHVRAGAYGSRPVSPPGDARAIA